MFEEEGGWCGRDDLGAFFLLAYIRCVEVGKIGGWRPAQQYFEHIRVNLTAGVLQMTLARHGAAL